MRPAGVHPRAQREGPWRRDAATTAPRTKNGRRPGGDGREARALMHTQSWEPLRETPLREPPSPTAATRLRGGVLALEPPAAPFRLVT